MKVFCGSVLSAICWGCVSTLLEAVSVCCNSSFSVVAVIPSCLASNFWIFSRSCAFLPMRTLMDCLNDFSERSRWSIRFCISSIFSAFFDIITLFANRDVAATTCATHTCIRKQFRNKHIFRNIIKEDLLCVATFVFPLWSDIKWQAYVGQTLLGPKVRQHRQSSTHAFLSVSISQLLFYGHLKGW